MSTRRTPQIKKAMSVALGTVIDYLKHPDLPHLPRYITPDQMTNVLETCLDIINNPGGIRGKKSEYVLGSLQHIADYLSNPKVTRLNFTIRSSNIARMLREVIRDLK